MNPSHQNSNDVIVIQLSQPQENVLKDEDSPYGLAHIMKDVNMEELNKSLQERCCNFNFGNHCH
jgi:hypothetical protein